MYYPRRIYSLNKGTHMTSKFTFAGLAFISILTLSAPAMAGVCKDLPSHADLKTALTDARKESNGGFNLDMWGSVVARDGTVCAVAYTGETEGDQWPGSRVISAQKANTANAFSLKGLALSTANLYAAVQPGGSLFGLQESNPVNTDVAYAGKASKFGTKGDPMTGKRIGGVNVFGGGLALYNDKGDIVGGLGVSGDSSCADHNIAWRARHALKLDYVPAGVAPTKDDQIIFGKGGFTHPTCGGTENTVAKTLSPVSKMTE